MTVFDFSRLERFEDVSRRDLIKHGGKTRGRECLVFCSCCADGRERERERERERCVSLLGPCLSGALANIATATLE